MNRIFTTLIVLGWAVSGKAQQQGQTSTAFSLKQAIDYAYKNSPNYLNAELDVKNSIYMKNEVLGSGLPQLTASVDLKDYIELPTSLIPAEFFGGAPGTFAAVKFGTKYNATAGLSLQQLVFSSDYIIGLKAAKEVISLSTIAVNRSKVEVAASVSKAYFSVVINKERLGLLDANVERLKTLLANTRAFNEQGFVERIDVSRLEVSYNNLVTERERVDRLIGLSETMLKFQMGYKLSDAISLTDSLTTEKEDLTILDNSRLDFSKRPEYQLLQTQQRLNEMNLKRQRWGYLPTLVAYGSLNYNAQRQTFDFFDANQPWYKITLIGGTLNLNVFDGLQRHYRIQQAKIALLKGQNNIRNLELGIEAESTTASINYTNAFSTMQTQKRNMALAQEVYDVAQEKYRQGVGSNIEVVDAETSLKESQTNYYNALYDLVVYKINYLQATGSLIK